MCTRHEATPNIIFTFQSRVIFGTCFKLCNNLFIYVAFLLELYTWIHQCKAVNFTFLVSSKNIIGPTFFTESTYIFFWCFSAWNTIWRVLVSNWLSYVIIIILEGTVRALDHQRWSSSSARPSTSSYGSSCTHLEHLRNSQCVKSCRA